MHYGLNVQLTLLCACRVHSVNLLKLFMESFKYLTYQSAHWCWYLTTSVNLIGWFPGNIHTRLFPGMQLNVWSQDVRRYKLVDETITYKTFTNVSIALVYHVEKQYRNAVTITVKSNFLISSNYFDGLTKAVFVHSFTNINTIFKDFSRFAFDLCLFSVFSRNYPF